MEQCGCYSFDYINEQIKVSHWHVGVKDNNMVDLKCWSGFMNTYWWYSYVAIWGVGSCMNDVGWDVLGFGIDVLWWLYVVDGS